MRSTFVKFTVHYKLEAKRLLGENLFFIAVPKLLQEFKKY